MARRIRASRLNNLRGQINASFDRLLERGHEEESTEIVERLQHFRQGTPTRRRRQPVRPPRLVTLRIACLDGAYERRPRIDNMGIQQVVVPLEQTEEQFLATVREKFPRLADKDFDMCRQTPNHTFVRFDVSPICPQTLKECVHIGRSAIYLRSKEDNAGGAVMTSAPVPVVSPADEDVMLVHEHSQITNESLEQTRQIRMEQNQEFLEGLAQDRERERQEQEHQQRQQSEERRILAVEQRRIRQHPASSVGVMIQIKYPDGSIRSRRFSPQQALQDLSDFAGSVEDATEVFLLRVPSEGRRFQSNWPGTLAHHGINNACTMYIQWMDPDEVEEPPYSQEGQHLTTVDLTSTETFSSDGGESNRPDICSLLKNLTDQLNRNETTSGNMINVVREDVFSGAVRAFTRPSFDPKMKLNVVFVDDDGVGEGAVDDGGPTREFCRLLLHALHNSSMLEGPDYCRNLALDTYALEKGHYVILGQALSICLLHGGVCPHFFSERLYNTISGRDTGPVSINDIFDHDLRDKLLKEARDINEARAAIGSAADSLSVLGALGVSVTTLTGRDMLVSLAAKFYVKGRMEAPLKQFLQGLECLGLLQCVKEHPDLFKPIFEKKEKTVTAESIIDLFRPCFARIGSNRRRAEAKAYGFFRDWLLDVESQLCAPLTLSQVLVFASGVEEIPPLGFNKPCMLEFLHEGLKLPTANTCDVILRVPTTHSSYEDFKEWMVSGIIQAPHFGLA